MTTTNSYFTRAFAAIQNNDPLVTDVSVGMEEECPYGYGHALGLAVSQNTTITHLCLNLNKILPKRNVGEPFHSQVVLHRHMASIRKFLSHSRTLQKVTLWDTEVPFHDESPFTLCVRAIDNNVNVEDLDTTNVTQTGPAFDFLPSRKFMSFLMTSTSVKLLYIDLRLFSYVHDIDTETVRNAMVQSTFEELTIQYLPKQQFWFSSILQMVHGHPTLKQLMISKLCGDAKKVLDMLSSVLNVIPQLERLILQNFDFHNGYFQHHLADALMESPKLTTLSFLHCDFQNAQSELFSFMQSQRTKIYPIRRLKVCCKMLLRYSNCPPAQMLTLTVPSEMTASKPSSALIQELLINMEQDLVGDFWSYLSENAAKIVLPSLYVHNVKESGWTEIVEGIPNWIHMQNFGLNLLEGNTRANPQEFVHAIKNNGSLFKVFIKVQNSYQENINEQFLDLKELEKVQSYCQRNKLIYTLLSPDAMVLQTIDVASNNHCIIPLLLYALHQVQATRLWHTIRALRQMGEALVAAPNLN